MNRTTRTKANGNRGRKERPAEYPMARSSSGAKPQRLSASASAYHMTPGARGQAEALRRIRTPHPNDILCGRGGSINNHPGNKTYRTWVHERKNEYNLALSKAEKARISREILDLVQAQDPPGKFLTKDPAASPLMGNIIWWMEIDDVKAMAKTSQALREGAPAIRADHKHEIYKTQKESGSLRNKSSRKAQAAEDASPEIPMSLSSDDLAIEALRTAAEAAKHGMGQGEHVAPFLSNEMFEQSYERPSKMMRIDSTPTPPPEKSPPLMPFSSEEEHKSFVSFSTLSSMKRAHSLSLSEVDSGDLEEEFVNPFEDESDYTNGNNLKYHVPSLARSSADSTTSSVGNLSFGSLFKSSSEHATNYQQRNGNNNGTPHIRKNVSSRSMVSELSDLPDPGTPKLGDADFHEGLRTVWAAIHPDVTSPGNGDAGRAPLFPFKGGSQLTRRLSPKRNPLARTNEERQ